VGEAGIRIERNRRRGKRQRGRYRGRDTCIGGTEWKMTRRRGRGGYMYSGGEIGEERHRRLDRNLSHNREKAEMKIQIEIDRLGDRNEERERHRRRDTERKDTNA
jgi:hypothetical protein